MKFIYIDESGGLKWDFNYILYNIRLLVINNEKDLKMLKNTIKKLEEIENNYILMEFNKKIR